MQGLAPAPASTAAAADHSSPPREDTVVHPDDEEAVLDNGDINMNTGKEEALSNDSVDLHFTGKEEFQESSSEPSPVPLISIFFALASAPFIFVFLPRFPFPSVVHPSVSIFCPL
jgi:hypothetical protein